MDALGRTLAMLTLLVLGVLPSSVYASDKSKPTERREHEGLLLGVRVVSGATMHGPQGFTPVTRLSYSVGGAVTSRLVLGLDLGVTALWDDKKASFHGDTMGQLFIVRGLFLRAATGVASHTYVAGDRRAAFGGSLGAGWEWPLRKHGFVALSGEYDARIRGDRFPVRTLLFGISIGAYSDKK